MCITSISTLLQGIVDVPSVFDVTIHGLQTDSRAVRSGDAFIALAGSATPAEHYVDDAIAAGATAVLLEASEHRECHERSGALIVPVVVFAARWGGFATGSFELRSGLFGLFGSPGPIA